MTIDLKTLLNDHQPFHSNLQIDRFIVAKSGGTEYGMYMQAVRELNKRWRGLKDLYSQRELLNIDIAEFECGHVDDEDDFFNHARAEVKKAQKLSQVEDLEQTIADTEREFSRFYSIASSLKESLGELTEDVRDALDLQMWIHKATHECAKAMLLGRPHSQSSLELMASLPVEARDEVRTALNAPGGLDWFINYDPQLPVVRELPAGEVQQILSEAESAQLDT
jgi:hypothetical protein